jgi:hypothetical protein
MNISVTYVDLILQKLDQKYTMMGNVTLEFANFAMRGFQITGMHLTKRKLEEDKTIAYVDTF